MHDGYIVLPALKNLAHVASGLQRIPGCVISVKLHPQEVLAADAALALSMFEHNIDCSSSVLFHSTQLHEQTVNLALVCSA